MAQNGPVRVEVLSQDLDFIRALRVEPLETAGHRLSPGSPTRMPGAVDTFGQIVAHADSAATGVLSSLVAAWIWQAKWKAGSKLKARVTIQRWGRRVDIAVEGDTEAETAALLQSALDHVDPAR